MMHAVNHPRDERGASAVFMGLAITVLVAAVGLAVDIGNVEYQATKAQHAADAAARRVAVACAKKEAACEAPVATAQTVAAQNIDGASVSASVTAPQVDVSVTKTIDTPLLSLIGVRSKDVAATARASWNGGFPTEGYPVLPLGVSYCTWKNNSAAAGTATEADPANHMAIRTDTLQSLRNILSPLNGTLSVLRLDSLMNMLGTSSTDACTDTDGTQLLTFKGGIWLTGEHVITGLLSGTWEETNSCRVRIGNDLSTFLAGAESALFIPSGCASKIGQNKPVHVGSTILLPVYKPASTLQNRLGFKLSTCVGLGTKLGSLTCLELPPKIGVQIVGFAPFTVTGWKYPGAPAGYPDPAVGCPNTSWSLNPYAIVNETFTLLEKLLNVVSQLLTNLLGIGTLTASLACNGLHGYFTKTFTRDPNFTYSTGGVNLGASDVRLTR